MKKIVFVVAVLLLSVVPTLGQAARTQAAKVKKNNGTQLTVAKLVGVWVPTGSKKGAASTTQSIAFTSDGQLTLFGQATVKGKVQKFQSVGTFKIVKGGFTLTAQGQTQTLKVTKLTGNALVTSNDQGIVSSFKKKSGPVAVKQTGSSARKAATAKAAGKKPAKKPATAKAAKKKKAPLIEGTPKVASSAASGTGANPASSLTNPDGTPNLANPQARAQLSGLVPPGTVVNPDGSFKNADGSLNLTFDPQARAQLSGQVPPGTTVNPDGSFTNADGTLNVSFNPLAVFQLTGGQGLPSANTAQPQGN